MATQSIEIGLVGDQRPQFGLLLERGGKRIERLGIIAGQRPVARQVVVQERFVGILTNRSFERVDSLGEPIGSSEMGCWGTRTARFSRLLLRRGY